MNSLYGERKCNRNEMLEIQRNEQEWPQENYVNTTILIIHEHNPNATLLYALATRMLTMELFMRGTELYMGRPEAR